MSKKQEIFVLALIMLAAVFLSSYCLKTSPAFWFDEGIFYQVVNNLAVNGQLGLPLSPTTSSDLSLISMGYPIFLPAVLAFKIFGSGVIVIRMVAIAFLLGFFIVAFFLAKKLYGLRVALATMLLLVTFSPLYGNGKSFLGEVPGLFFFLTGLFILTILEQSKIKRIYLAFLGGIFFGFAVSAKPIFILILPALAAGLAVQWRNFLASRQDRRITIALLVGLGFAVNVWVWTQFDFSTTSISSVFGHFVNPNHLDKTAPAIFVNLLRFFTESTPMFFLLQLCLAVYYFFYCFKRRIHISATKTIIFTFAFLIFAAYLRNVGWYRYFFPGQVMVYFFMIPGLLAIETKIKNSKYYGRYFVPIVFSAILVVQILPLSKNALTCIIDAPTAIEPYLKSLDEHSPVLFYSLPQLAARYEGSAAYQYIKMNKTVILGEDNLDLLNQDFFSRIFIEENDMVGKEQLPSCFKLDQTIRGIDIYRRDLQISCKATTSSESNI